MLRPVARFVSALCLCVIGSACSFAQEPALPAQTRLDESRLVKLSGTLHPLARPENDRGAVSDSFPADRMFALLDPPADRKQALEQFLRDAHAPGSPSYHKWISPEEFGARFGARDEDVLQLQSWLQSHGFSVARLTKSRHFLEFSGTAAQVREALHAEIHQYEVEGKTYHSVSTDVSIPESIAPLIRGFAPLNTFPLTSYVHTAGKGKLSRATNRVQPDFTTTTGGSTFYAVSPKDFATQYNVGPLYSAGTDGTGTTIGIVGTGNLNLSVVDAFRKLYGLPGDNTQVVIDGEDPGAGLAPNIEGFLDVEVSGAVAPKATVNYYIAGGNHFQSGLILATMRAIEDNQADILSVSFGECEQLLGPVNNQFWATLWEEAAAQGQTVLVASGDSGPATCGNAVIISNGQLTHLGLSVNGLASTPWNVAVGGTDFYYSDYVTGGTSIANLWNSTNDANFGSLKAPLPEQPWDNTLGLNIVPSGLGTPIVAGGAAGGGPSSCSQFTMVQTPSGFTFVCAGGYPKPTWQNAPGVPSDNVRDLPDVSLFAASGKNLSAYAICAEPGDCAPVTTGDPHVFLVGGTSASTPAMAGIMALVNQKFGRQGQANFTLYALARQQPNVFHDITIGTNDVLCFTGTPGCFTPVPNTLGLDSYGVYAAAPGYDMASGLGSFDASALINNWNTVTSKLLQTSTTLQLSPSSIVHGTDVSITATVKANSGTAIPTGDVNIKTTSPTPLRVDFVPLAGGTAITNWSFFPGGTYQVTAEYAGDGTFASSASPASTLTVTPEPSTTALSLQYENLAPSGGFVILQTGTVPNGGQAPFSSIWTFQAQPSGQVPKAFGDATGTATFTDGSTSVTVPLNSQGIAAWSPRVLAVGAHSVTVSYSGDASYTASTAGPLTFTVTPGTPEFISTLEARPVSIPPNPPTFLAGSTAIIHVLLRALNSFVPPTGNVTVNFGALPPQTAMLTADTFSNQGLSAVNFTFPNVAAGTYALSASYAGDANWNSGTFTGATYTFATATASATSTSLSLTPSSVDSSGAVQFTVTVTGPQGTTLPPVGGATLFANGSAFAGVRLIPSTPANTPVSTGIATVPATALPSGSLQVTALYLGGLGFAPSSSAPVPLTVTFSNFTMSAGLSRVVIKSGASASVPLLLGGPNGGSTTVSLACSPSSASFGCAVNPATQMVTDSTSASLTINAFIPGTASTAKLESIGERRALFAASAGFALAFFFVLASPRRELRRSLLLSLAMLAIGTFAAGCGGSSSPPPSPPPPPNINAPPGTYAVVVNATSGGISHNVKVTVVIQ